MKLNIVQSQNIELNKDVIKMKYCNKCGEKLSSNTQFCSNCGKKVENLSQNSKSKFIPWYIIGGLILLIIIIVVVTNQIQKQNGLKIQLQQAREEKQFCDNLKISIEPVDIARSLGGLANVGLNVC